MNRHPYRKPKTAVKLVEAGRVSVWDFYPKGLSDDSEPLTPILKTRFKPRPSRAPAHLPASYQGEPHE